MIEFRGFRKEAKGDSNRVGEERSLGKSNQLAAPLSLKNIQVRYGLVSFRFLALTCATTTKIDLGLLLKQVPPRIRNSHFLCRQKTYLKHHDRGKRTVRHKAWPVRRPRPREGLSLFHD